MKVAIAIWKDRISPVFDVSKKILILDIENNAVSNKAFEIFENDNATHKVNKLMGLKVETLICGAISNPLSEMITIQGIQTIPFTCGKITDVIHAYLKNALPNHKLSMPGCCGFRKRIRGRTEEDQHIKIKEVIHMPKGDGTGPDGQGPMTGKNKGKCGSKSQQPNAAKGCKGGGRRQGGQGRKDNKQGK